MPDTTMISSLLAASNMSSKLTLIAPEILLFVGSVVVAVLGLARSTAIRRAVPTVTALFLLGSIGVTAYVYRTDAVETSNLLLPQLGGFVKALIAVIGILLVMIAGPAIDRRLEEAFDSGGAAFDPIRVMRGEYFAFFLLSLAGTMLIANANDLIWLFLAIELSSLPTYVMVAVSRGSRRAQEAAVKYFYLGALSAATFLYGFALLYGASGTLDLAEMRVVFANMPEFPTLAILGGVMAILGIAFKLAAVPMHFYAPDVYEGAGSQTTAFLGFMPKIAGAVALMVLLGVFWTPATDASGAATAVLPNAILATLWMIAVLTMVLGNIGALLQRNVKRMLAYSSIAQSGYLLIGIVTGPGAGYNSILFYLIGYGVMNTAVFAVLGSLERQGEEVETLDDLSGLRQRQPALAWMLALSAIGLIGIPPLIGFFGKLALFAAAIDHGQTALVIIAAVTTAVSAFYYLQLVAVPMLGSPTARTDAVHAVPSSWPRIAAVVCGVGVLVMPLAIERLVTASGATEVPTTESIEAAAGAVETDAVDAAALQPAAPSTGAEFSAEIAAR